MILTNYWAYLTAINDFTITTFTTNAYIQTGMKATDGTSNLQIAGGSRYTGGPDYAPVCNNQIRRGLDLLLGSGTTAPTASDYNVESAVSLTNISNTTALSSENGFKTQITQTVRNDGESAVTINEIGVRKIFYKNVETTAEYAYVLMARKVLDTPIIIQPSETKTITFIWDEA